ncbi:MAG: tetratricopeptide repeat protein [Planctomycetota bacterium]|nr:tetratricopeptide repeat protein [Planctomycetota bacterium]
MSIRPSVAAWCSAWLCCCVCVSLWADESPAKTDSAKAADAKKTGAEKSPSRDADAKTAKDAPEKPPVEKTVQELAAAVRDSVVVVSYLNRDGKQAGVGTGFVVGQGLIATNLHVIGEARPIVVTTADKKRHEVIEVHATDKRHDLALLRIASKSLIPLALGDSDQLKQGQPIMAMGNPMGLKHSVVSGVVSGRQEIDGRRMIQLAIPIERGNSGGPLMDRQGRVHGLLTLKSAVTANLGFAAEINALKPLLLKPNPVPIDRWLTIGRLSTEDWKQLFGANWRQRAGRIQVQGRGSGFGGRSLCLSTKPMPKLPFEVGVRVRMDYESGAAGLVFHSDGTNRHYGFYPSSGNLRFSRFDGPDVFSWQVLKELASPHYRPGEWNALKVRVDENKIQCFVNDELVIESTDAGLTSGSVGLAKFRDTEAEFKQFQVAAKIADSRPPKEAVERIAKLVPDVPANEPPSTKLVEQLLPDADVAPEILREQAEILRRRATRLTELAAVVHREQVQQEMAKLLKLPEDKIDLLHAALLIARLNNADLDVDHYLHEVDRMVAEIKQSLKPDATEHDRIAALDKYLFKQLGFHGGRTNYYSRSNSYLNEVIDDREGLPITMSVLYAEMARRVGANVVGVGLPGHFVVRFEPKKGKHEIIDVFNEANRLTEAEAMEQIEARIGRRDKSFLESQSKRAIVVRMLRNLMGIARNEEKPEEMLRYVDTMVSVDPGSGESRFFRAVLRMQTGRLKAAAEDADWLLDNKPGDVDQSQVREFRELLDRQLRKS